MGYADRGFQHANKGVYACNYSGIIMPFMPVYGIGVLASMPVWQGLLGHTGM